MTKIAEKVRIYLDNNFIIRKCLSKNIISLRALSRHLCNILNLEQKNLDAVMSSIRRYKKEESKIRDESLKKIFSYISIKTRSNIADIYMVSNKENQQNLIKLYQKIDFERGEILRIIQSEQGIRVIIDEKNLKKFYDIFPKKGYVSVDKGLTEINIQFTKEASQTKGIISLISSTLYADNINIVEIISCAPELLIFVKNEDLLKSLQIINNIKDNI
ncbi:MAG: hypothetical protein KJ968_01585 [Nanoarchaeota archaeon]|nr:hypothetical protein [Nanoarchaeota archaeon]